MQRHVHFLGSMPFSNATMQQTMQTLLRDLRGHLVSLPDGEPRDGDLDRSEWVHTAVRFLSASNDPTAPDKHVFDNGEKLDDRGPDKPADYALVPRVPVGELASRITAAGLGYRHFARQSWPVFRKALQEEGQQDDPVAFQVGVPSSFDVAIFTMSNVRDKFRYMPALRQALAAEINAFAAEVGHRNVVFQIEVPMETVISTKVPLWLAPRRLFYAELFQLVKLLDARVRVGVHVCVGDDHHEAYAQVNLPYLLGAAQAVVDSWPRHIPLEVVHVPLAEAKLPPHTDAAFYEPFRTLWLPAHTRLIAGFVHEAVDTEQLVGVLRAIEGYVGHKVDVANSCGLGRIDEPTVRRLLQISAAVAKA